MKVILLAGGFARRMQPITNEVPKPLLPLKGKPIIQHLVEKVKVLPGVSGVIVSTNEKFAPQFRNWLDYSKDGKGVELVVEPVRSEQVKMGQMAALRFVIEQARIDEDVLIIAGDNVFDCALKDIVAFGKGKKAAVVAAHDMCDMEKVRGRFGVMALDAENRVLEFQEKPERPKSTLASTGIYYYPKHVLPEISRYLSETGNPDAAGHFIAWLAARMMVYGYPFKERWLDVGHIDTYNEANASEESVHMSKLLLLTEFYPIETKVTGGVEARTFAIVEALKRKYDVTVICSRRGNELDEQDGRLKVVRLGPAYPYSNTGHVFRRLLFAFNAYRQARKETSDIIEGTNFLTYVPAALAALRQGVPRVATYHESWVGGQWIKGKGWWVGTLGEIWERIALRLGWTHFISVSEFTKRNLVKVRVPEQKVTVVPNGIDVKEFAFKVKKERKPTIVCVSRLIPSKKVDVLVRAIPYVVRRVPDVQVRVVGHGDQQAALERLADSLGVRDHITFYGRVPENRDKNRLIKESHVFALPSELEGFGIVVAEAMACGLPVVCADIPPLREVTDAKGGFLFPPGDSEKLAEHLVTLLTEKDVYTEKAAEASVRAKEYDWPNIIARLESTYKAILAKK